MVRIGINIGDIILEDGDIYGDGVNVAARLEGLAEPGGICIARNVYNQVKNKLAFGFEPMGAHRVKNIAEPVSVYRVQLGTPGMRLRKPARRIALWPALAAAAALRGGGGTLKTAKHLTQTFRLYLAASYAQLGQAEGRAPRWRRLSSWIPTPRWSG